MATKNVGTLINEARTAKKLSQTALAAEVDGLSGTDIGKAERGEKELTQAQLKAIAKVLGVTQKSLLEAPKGGTSSSSAKTAASKAGTSAKKTSTASKTGSGAKKTSSSGTKTETLTTTEKKLIELYRAASSDNKKLATRILRGDQLELADILPMLMNNGTIGEDGLLGGLLGKLQGMMK